MDLRLIEYIRYKHNTNLQHVNTEQNEFFKTYIVNRHAFAWTLILLNGNQLRTSLLRLADSFPWR